jgi:hypothetical protein
MRNLTFLTILIILTACHSASKMNNKKDSASGENSKPNVPTVSKGVTKSVEAYRNAESSKKISKSSNATSQSISDRGTQKKVKKTKSSNQ